MTLTVAIRWFLLVSICAAMFAMSTLADEVGAPAESSGSGHEGLAKEPTQLRGTGLLIIDPRDSRVQVKDRIRRLFSFDGKGVTPSEQRQAEIARTVNALFDADDATANEIPEVFFEFRQKTSVSLFRADLLSSELARQSDEVCPEDCPFRELDEDSLHVHLTAPTGGPGDSVLVLKILESYDSPEKGGLSSAPLLRRDWLKRSHEPGARPTGLRVFGLRVTLTDSEN